MRQGQSTYPDVHPGNILFDGKSLSIIDPHAEVQETRYGTNIKDDALQDIISLFKYNKNLEEIVLRAKDYGSIGEDINQMFYQNNLYTVKNIKRMLGVFTKIYGPIVVKDLFVYNNCVNYAVDAVGKLKQRKTLSWKFNT